MFDEGETRRGEKGNRTDCVIPFVSWTEQTEGPAKVYEYNFIEERIKNKKPKNSATHSKRKQHTKH